MVAMKTVFLPMRSARNPIDRLPTRTKTGPADRIIVLVVTDTFERKGNERESGPIVAIIPHRKKLDVLDRINDF
jgi:hypothetical protein